MSAAICPHCMTDLQNNQTVCPRCGRNTFVDNGQSALRAGTMLNDGNNHTFILGKTIGSGGFGITYIGKETNSKRLVAIKEYYPTICVTQRTGCTVKPSTNLDAYQHGLKSFLSEASMLRAVAGIKSIVHVLDYFEANNTAYMVMDYLDGMTLRNVVEKYGAISFSDLLPKLRPFMSDLDKLHEAGVVHRDIAPDNIMLMPDGTLRLLDFGCARSMEDGKTMTVVLKPGFAPIEQYQTKGQGPYTDIYALCATIYYCITGGKIPQASPDRLSNDQLKRPTSFENVRMHKTNENVLIWGLSVNVVNRPQRVNDLSARFVDEKPDGTSITSRVFSGYRPTGPYANTGVQVTPGASGGAGYSKSTPGQPQPGGTAIQTGVSQQGYNRSQGYTPPQGYSPSQGYAQPQQQPPYTAPQQGGYTQPQQNPYTVPQPGTVGYPQQGGMNPTPAQPNVKKSKLPIIIAGIVAAVVLVAIIAVVAIFAISNSSHDTPSYSGGGGGNQPVAPVNPGDNHDTPTVPDTPDTPDIPDAPVVTDPPAAHETEPREVTTAPPDEPEVFTDGDYQYTVTKGGAVITKYTGNEDYVVTPDTFGNYNIIGIAANAFTGNDMSVVALPLYLETLEDGAFNGCGSLRIVNSYSDAAGNKPFNNCPLLRLIAYYSDYAPSWSLPQNTVCFEGYVSYSSYSSSLGENVWSGTIENFMLDSDDSIYGYLTAEAVWVLMDMPSSVTSWTPPEFDGEPVKYALSTAFDSASTSFEIVMSSNSVLELTPEQWSSINFSLDGSTGCTDAFAEAVSMVFYKRSYDLIGRNAPEYAGDAQSVAIVKKCAELIAEGYVSSEDWSSEGVDAYLDEVFADTGWSYSCSANTEMDSEIVISAVDSAIEYFDYSTNSFDEVCAYCVYRNGRYFIFTLAWQL